MKTQNQRIEKYLLSGKSLTGLQALRMFGCFRLASRIWDCKESGLKVKVKMITRDKKTYAQYYL